ncbi:MAG: SUMF1/EgtB/PvdO family nonheme iron enzyme [Candidatus Thiodiazotropha taylori]|nr:SUMF1/EgtB/PvdO family nonheme iron enzyme [Candidatus Thiodiazotropha taylori]
MIRGGSWNNKPRKLRSANRNRNNPDKRNNNLGFRLAQSARAALCQAPSRPVHGQVGSGARVSMSPVPGLAGLGAPNSFVRDDVGRG